MPFVDYTDFNGSMMELVITHKNHFGSPYKGTDYSDQMELFS